MFEQSAHAKEYAQYRPTYQEDVYKTIFKYCHECETGQSLAVDIACGSGQGTLPLRHHFDWVIGIDTSQVSCTNHHPV